MGSVAIPAGLTSSIFKREKLSQLEEEYLAKVVKKSLPHNYNFEVEKCIYRIRHHGYRSVSLQMPEGLLAWAQEIAEILQFFCPSLKEVCALHSQVVIMGDVTYGACCIDDYTATSLDCELVIHYGHSCLVPVTDVSVNCLYVFVEISFSAAKLAAAIESCFGPDLHILLMGTIQYSNVVRECAAILNSQSHFKYAVDIPQVSPLLPGEVLGCTSPVINVRPTCKTGPPEDTSHASQVIVFVADGRFHLESTLIQNPGLKLYRFDPFNKVAGANPQVFSEESYDLDCLHEVRKRAILRAREARRVCLVLSTLGRQGNANILNNISGLLHDRGVRHCKLLLSEITIDKLKNLDFDAFVQIGCPRLSIDWGDSFPKPLLNPYEAYVAFKDVAYRPVYPMDYYSRAGGEWSNYTASRCRSPADAACCRGSSTRDAIRQRLLQRSLMAKQVSYSGR